MKETLLDQYASLLSQGPVYDPAGGGGTAIDDHDNHPYLNHNRPSSSNNHHHHNKPSSANSNPLQMSLIPVRSIHTPMSMSASMSAPSIPILQRASTSPSRIHQSSSMNVQG